LERQLLRLTSYSDPEAEEASTSDNADATDTENFEDTDI